MYLGDCREILPELQSESFDMVVFDDSCVARRPAATALVRGEFQEF